MRSYESLADLALWILAGFGALWVADLLSLVLGPLAIVGVIVGILAILSKARGLWLGVGARRPGSLLLVLMSLGMVASLFLSIWGRHPGRPVPVDGELVRCEHAHELWETGHIH